MEKLYKPQYEHKNIYVLMLAMFDQRSWVSSQKLDIYLIFDQDEKTYQKRRMIQTGNILMENHEDGLLK